MKVMVESHTLGKNIGGKRTKMHGQKGFYYDTYTHIFFSDFFSL